MEKLKKYSFIAIIIAVYFVLQIGTFSYFDSKYDSEIENLLETTQKANLDQIVIGEEKIKNIVSQEMIDILHKEEEIGRILSKVDLGNEKRFQKLRENLEDILEEPFQKLQKSGFANLHIHLTNKVSFLRMHDFDKFGDNLDFRESVNIINLENSSIHGFESGRTANVFRYIVPLFYKSEFVGSLEVGYTEEKLFEILKEIYPTDNYYFLIDEESVKLLDKYKEDFENLRNTSFLTRKESLIPENVAEEILKIENLRDFSKTSTIFEEKQILNLIPIQNFANKNIAYIISVQQNDQIAKIQSNNWTDILLASFLLISLLALAIYREIQRNFVSFEEKYLNSILNSQKDIIFVSDGKKVSNANSAFLNFFSITSIKNFNKNSKCVCDFFEKIEKPDYIYKDKFDRSWIKTVLDNPETDFRVVIKNSTGNPVTFSISAKYMDFDTKKQSVITLKNISTFVEYHDKLEKEVSEQAQRLDENIRIIEENVIVTGTDKNGIINYVSEAFLRMSGYSREAIIGKRHSLFKHPDTPRELYKDLWNTITNGDVWEGEIQNLDSFGRDYWMKVNIHPRRDAKNRIDGYVAIRQDITDKKQVEWMQKRDQLTSLGNREYFKQVFEETVKENISNDKPVSLVLIFMDNLREYNINYSLQKGDSLIRSIAVILRKHATCGKDAIFRLAGGEFTVLCGFKDEGELKEFSERIRQAVENAGYHHNANGEHNVATISVGAFFSENLNPEHDGDQIYAEVSSLIQVSRRKGGNTVEMLVDNPD
ncbi:PAS domain S-box/diguanylate cyclase (GGDEF) domain-containing protein [Thiovulum sp. ES]|nr:PAS domain S-box/diguanylate cyclase (GGDEF) domain-containing protein [Thiovulum sp. ES]